MIDSPLVLPKQALDRPIVATIAAVVDQGRIALMRRSKPPDAGRWAFPGGKIDMGEALELAALRELQEETGIHASARSVFTAVDAFEHDDAGRAIEHYVLIGVLCSWRSGEPIAGDDALEAGWFRLDEVERLDVARSIDVVGIARRAISLESPPAE